MLYVDAISRSPSDDDHVIDYWKDTLWYVGGTMS